MAPSSSSPGSQRRRRPKPLARTESSLLGTIKNIVTAPLAWFASTDDLDSPGSKRRRPVSAPQAEDDDAARPQRNKRMRVRSPTPPHLPSTAPAMYLDPPVSAFRPAQPSSARSASYDIRHSNASFARANPLSRTMSIDPPARPLASASRPLRRDVSIDGGSFMRSSARDLSLPPLSSHPSFRIRTSTTPQPHPYRDKSEPPQLSSLASNPTFVRAPPTNDSLHVAIPAQPSVTLGSLVDSVRSTRSPVRQHSSLFDMKVEHSSISPRPISAIEKALHELDIYKTPLVPTRLRSSNTPAPPPSSDLFKSRRTSQLVLMQEDKRQDRLGRKAKNNQISVTNETKPYAGQGGMKKLLARRKLEQVEEEKVRVAKPIDQDQSAFERDDDMVEARDESEREIEKPSRDADNPSRVSPFLSTDPFSSTSTSASTQGATSSLRVGRTKTSRNHIARPAARPMRMKFSAAYDDDDAMDDGEEEAGRKKEKEFLEETAKRTPVFKVPEGFTFAKDVAPVKHDLTKAKEPPITSLPFSFAKSVLPTSEAPTTIQPTVSPTFFASPPVASVSMDSQTGPSAPPSVAVENVEPAVSMSVRPPHPVVTVAPPLAATSGDGVPNFFANSSVLTQSIAVPKTPPLVFPSAVTTQVAETSTTTVPVLNGFTPSEPVKDIENPLWEGEHRKKTTPTGPSTLFGGFGQVGNEGTASAAASATHTPAAAAMPAPTPSVSVFGAIEKKSEDVGPAQPDFFTKATPSAGTAASTPSFSFNGDIPKPTASTMLFGSTESKPSGSSFGDIPKVSAPAPFSFDHPPSSSTNSNKLTAPVSSSSNQPSSIISKTADTPAFSFGQPATSPSTASATPKTLFSTFSDAAEAPKPLFSGTGGFSFAVNKEPEQKPANTPFSFGAAPSTPPAVDTKSSLFGFGAATSTPPAPAAIGFSFSSGSETTSADAGKPFAFGQPVTMMPTERSSTPPKNEEISMDESPTRDEQQEIKLSERPTLGGGGFSFGAPATNTPFGAQTNGSSSPFSFGATSSSSNPFAKMSKPEESKPFGGFDQSATTAASTAFSFGQPQDKEPARPSTAGSFLFGAAPSTAASSGPAFSFGAPPVNTASSMFGQTSTSSAPSSPSTFGNQASSPFTFGAPLPAVNAAFSFGPSQPASPAGGNVTLPAPTTPGGFGGGGGGFGQAQTASPFGAPAAISPAPSSNGPLFTIGAAPAPAAPPSGARQIRKLPTRRSGAKR